MKFHFLKLLSSLMLICSTQSSMALEVLEDKVLGDVSGEGLALAFEDIRFQMAPTSFIEFTGTDPGAVTTLKRGDIRYYGLALTSSTSGTGMDWFGNGCTDGARKLGCPMSNAGITNFANFDNPYVIRVFPYLKVDLAGNDTTSTVMELIGPTNTDTFRWAFWGEIESDRGGTRNAILKNQTMILGKPVTFTKSPSIYGTNTASNPYLGSVMQYLQYSGETTFGMIYNSRLSGDFRFSVRQNATGSDVRGVVPDFTDTEGLYVTDVNAFLPLGQLNYQTVTYNDTQANSGTATNNGNFVVELTAIPNTANVYNNFYSLPTALAPTGSCNAACQTINRGYNRVTSAAATRYHETHGFVEWGYKYPTCAQSNCMSGAGVSSVRFGTSPANADTIRNEGGLSFQGNTAWTVVDNQHTNSGTNNSMTSINTGSARMTGMNVNHLKFRSLGAN